MRLAELVVLYLLVGAGCAVASLSRPLGRRERIIDAAILAVLWPLYGPFLMTRPAAPGAHAPGDLLHALQQVRGSPLATLLPDARAVDRLCDRVRGAQSRVVEIEALLAQPELSERAAEAHARDLEARGGSRAAALVRKRAGSVARLRTQRDRLVRELDEIGEILVQLRLQAEVMRLADGAALDAEPLVPELTARLNSLDQLLSERMA